MGVKTNNIIFTARTGNLIFHDEVESVRQATSDLQAADPEVKVIIAVGHSGFATDQEIARQVEGVDIVVGGHTNTFLYTGKPIHLSDGVADGVDAF